jgi:hypothetical protein
MVTGSLQKVLALSGALLGRRARVALRAAVARVANASEIKPPDTSTPLNHYRASHSPNARCNQSATLTTMYVDQQCRVAPGHD